MSLGLPQERQLPPPMPGLQSERKPAIPSLLGKTGPLRSQQPKQPKWLCHSTSGSSSPFARASEGVKRPGAFLGSLIGQRARNLPSVAVRSSEEKPNRSYECNSNNMCICLHSCSRYVCIFVEYVYIPCPSLLCSYLLMYRTYICICVYR